MAASLTMGRDMYQALVMIYLITVYDKHLHQLFSELTIMIQCIISDELQYYCLI